MTNATTIRTDGYGNVSGTVIITDTSKAYTYPASNLNLTDVLFVSSAVAATSDTAVSGEIAQGTAMTLRLNGDGKDIGTVTCNADAGQINATKGSTTDAVALVVQGNDGTKDWYYSKQISGTDNVIVNASDIATEMGMTAGIDFTNCKIWLEVTEDSVAYAVEATPTTEVVKTNISSVEITDVETPVSNTALDTSAVCATQGVSTTAPVVTWTQNTDGSLAIRGNGEMAKFQSVKVDGVIVDAKNYTVTEGSTIITFKADYLQTLSVGTHTFEIVWTDGSASTNFTVKNNKADDNSSNNNNNNNNSSSDSTKNDQTQATQNSSTDTKKAAQSATNPKTEDASNPALGIILLVASLAGAVGSLAGKKGGK